MTHFYMRTVDLEYILHGTPFTAINCVVGLLLIALTVLEVTDTKA